MVEDPNIPGETDLVMADVLIWVGSVVEVIAQNLHIVGPVNRYFFGVELASYVAIDCSRDA